MKKMKAVFLLISVLGVLSLLVTACGSSSPSSPGSSGTSTPTPSAFNWSGGPVVLAAVAGENILGTSASGVAVDIATQGGPVSTAAVTMFVAGTPYACSFSATFSGPVTFPSGVVTTLNLADYANISGFTYMPGQTYAVTVISAGVTYGNSVTAPTGIPSFAMGTSGVTCTWSGSPQFTLIQAFEASPGTNRETYGGWGNTLTSPYDIASSALSGHTSGNYDITAFIENSKVLTGSTNSYISAGYVDTINY
jgi:hypothetical protein